MAKESEFLSSFENIKTLHNSAFEMVDEAIQFEEDDKPLDALKSYIKAVEIIDTALATLVGLPEDFDSVKVEWSDACKMIHKMKRARLELLQRVGSLRKTYALENDVDEMEVDLKKVYNNIESDSGRVQTYSEIAKDLRELKYQENSELISVKFICNNVRLNNINPNGEVTTVWDNSKLGIFCIEKDEKKLLKETYFIQCIKSKEESVANDDVFWIYPLNPSETECYRTESGSFIFPDLQSYEPGSAFELIIPKEENADEIVLEILQAILTQGVVNFKESQDFVQDDVNKRISANIVRCANFISQNLINGAQKTGQFVSYVTPSAISMMQGAPKNAAPVSKNVETTVAVVKSVTGAAAGATGYLAGVVGNALGSLGSVLAPHVQKHGSTLLSKSLGMEESVAEKKMQGSLTIAAGAIEGFGTVYSGLEESAKILGNNLSDNTVKVIEHKYGPSAGSLASETFDTVGNVIKLSQNVNYLNPKGLAKKTAKCAGKAIIEDLNKRDRNGTHFIAASSIYPNLKNLDASNN